MHRWLLMAVHDLGPQLLAKRVFLGQEKALRGEMQVAGKPAVTWGHVDFGNQLLRGTLTTEGRTDFSSEIRGVAPTGSFAHNAPNSPGLSRPWQPGGACFGTMDLTLGTLPFLEGL